MLFWMSSRFFSAAPAKIARPASPLMLAATMPEPASAVSKRHRDRLAGVGRSRPGDHQQRPGAALARRHRLVAKVGVARQDGPRLLVGVLGEVAQHDDDLVLDVERGVAVVAEVLTLRHDEAVAGEDRRAADLGVVRERERLHLCGGVERARRARLGRRDRARSSPRPSPGGELKDRNEVLRAGQRLRADRRQLGAMYSAASRSPADPACAPRAFGGQRLDVRARVRDCVAVCALTRAQSRRVRAAAHRENANRRMTKILRASSVSFAWAAAHLRSGAAASAFRRLVIPLGQEDLALAPPPRRDEVQAICVPSGEGTGNPSKPSE